jgi:hypothetical protein
LAAVIALGLAGALAIAVVLAVIYLSLRGQPDEMAPGYAAPFASFPNATLAAGDDLLLVSADNKMALYVPQGAYPHPATFILTPRPAEAMPLPVDSDSIRLFPEDVWMVLADGQLAGDVRFDQPVLICYWLDRAAEGYGQDSWAQARVQYFDPSAVESPWVDLPAQGGWEQTQVCAAVDHLSLFALALPRVAPEPAPAVPHSVSTPAIFPYEIPSP